jgi:hypothetical protein
LNTLPVLDAVMALLDNAKCLNRTGVQLVQLLFASSILASTVLLSSYSSPKSNMPTIDENPWVVSGAPDQYMDLL